MAVIDNIQGGAFNDSGGNIIANGSITFLLSYPCKVTGTGQVVQNVVQAFTLDVNGNVPVNTPLWGNDQLLPSGTYYIVNIYNSSGALVRGPENWVISGTSPIDLGTITAATPSVSYPVLGIASIPTSFSSTPAFVATSIFSVFTITLTGNVTSSTLSATANSFLVFQITQDGTGGRTFAWPISFNTPVVISPTASTTTTQLFYYDGTVAWPLTAGISYP